MQDTDIAFLEQKCNHIRQLLINEIAKLGVGHIGGCLSAVEALVALYYKEMRIDPKNPKMEGRDRFVLSKGHAGPALYAVLADKGYFPLSELDTLNRPGTNLPSHCDMIKTPGVDMTAGSLAQGICAAVGMAKASKILNDSAYIYCMIGDGESQEGAVWEAAMSATHFNLNNLIVFTDCNKYQIDGAVDKIMGLGSLRKKWEAFDWNVIELSDGHNMSDILDAIAKAKTSKEKPSMIILHTIKGKGVSFIEAMGAKNHNTTISEEQRVQAIEELTKGGK